MIRTVYHMTLFFAYKNVSIAFEYGDDSIIFDVKNNEIILAFKKYISYGLCT